MIKQAQFLKSSQKVKDCPPPRLPEYAFVGRSNVGKSSLINMLCNHKHLAKTSGTPGKTQLINHFVIDDAWYLVDLPGYGYAKTSKSARKTFQKMILDYLDRRENLLNTFILVDSRHEPQKIDLDFMRWMGEHELPFAIVFTKTDKLKKGALERNLDRYRHIMLQEWEQIPPYFTTSATAQLGREEILEYIDQTNQLTTS